MRAGDCVEKAISRRSFKVGNGRNVESRKATTNRPRPPPTSTRPCSQCGRRDGSMYQASGDAGRFASTRLPPKAEIVAADSVAAKFLVTIRCQTTLGMYGLSHILLEPTPWPAPIPAHASFERFAKSFIFFRRVHVFTLLQTFALLFSSAYRMQFPQPQSASHTYRGKNILDSSGQLL